MDDEKKFEIDRILDAVHSIHDLDKRTINELAGTLAGRFVIEKFKVKPWKWRAWKEGKGDMAGVEYDAKKQRLIIKAVSCTLHETVNATMAGWSHMVARKLRKATGSRFRNSGNLGYELSGEHPGTFLVPDQCIHRRLQKFPLVVLDIAVSESTPQVFRNAERFLEGSNGQTRLAIVIDINEHRTEEQKIPTRWGLSDDEIRKFTRRDPSTHILHWHSKESIPFLGDFNARVYLRFQNQDWRAIWEHKFSLDGSSLDGLGETPLVHDNSYISTKDLLPELDESEDLPLPLDALAGEMEDCLVMYQAQRAMVQEDIKLKKIRKAQSKKFRSCCMCRII